ncbi:hypothetical protein [uncultured Pseudokineococcus sp.]|uniref:hypothetical protein n=1 Tax=uncultured Pseudokineococcus sp. TaxID=1642928 RepID=UPI002632F93E|nr:hypothetical protein [uncultured Pseudokineococcus sp.]
MRTSPPAFDGVPAPTRAETVVVLGEAGPGLVGDATTPAVGRAGRRRAGVEQDPDVGSAHLQEVLERGRRVYTGVVVVLQLLGVTAALAAAALSAGGGSASVLVATALAAGWSALAVVHLLRGLPVLLLVVVGLGCAAVLPALVAGGTAVEADGALRVLPTTASAVLWVLAGVPGRLGPVLVRALVVGAVALGLASGSAALTGLGRLDAVGPLVTALLAVATLVVARDCAARAERSLAARRAAAVDLLVASDLTTSRRRLDGRLHDVVLGALATMVTADASRGPAVRELAAEALALLVAADADAGAAGPVRLPPPAVTAATTAEAGRPAVQRAVPPGARLQEGARRLADRAQRSGLVVEVRWEDARGRPDPCLLAAPTAAGARSAAALTAEDAVAVDALLDAVGECLRNVQRHAGTTSALLVCSTSSTAARALVADAGVGFDPVEVRPEAIGLSRSVHARLENVGGVARVRSRVGRGTVVQMAVPLSGAAGEPRGACS